MRNVKTFTSSIINQSIIIKVGITFAIDIFVVTTFPVPSILNLASWSGGACPFGGDSLISLVGMYMLKLNLSVYKVFLVFFFGLRVKHGLISLVWSRGSFDEQYRSRFQWEKHFEWKVRFRLWYIAWFIFDRLNICHV